MIGGGLRNILFIFKLSSVVLFYGLQRGREEGEEDRKKGRGLKRIGGKDEGSERKKVRA